MARLADFVDELAGTGVVRVGHEGLGDADVKGVVEVLGKIDAVRRAEMAGQAPVVDLNAAVWGGRMVYEACRFLAYRDLGEEELRLAFALEGPSELGEGAASRHYSVDLMMSYLPDVLGLAKGIAEADPLVGELRRLARAWPLSSVGVKGAGGVDEVDVSGFWGDRSLRQLYVDRIIERSHRERARDPVVREAVRAAVGAHGALLAWDLKE